MNLTIFKAIKLTTLLLFLYPDGHAQEKKFVKQHINALAGNTMHGRGYVERGMEKASQYISRKYQQYGLKPINTDGYHQYFHHPVNTFPDSVFVKVGNKTWMPGRDFLVHPASNSTRYSKRKIKSFDVLQIPDSGSVTNSLSQLKLNQYVYRLNNVDSFIKRSGLSPRRFTRLLPKGNFIVPQKRKLIWSVAQDTLAGCVFQVTDSFSKKALKRRMSSVVESKFNASFRSANVVGIVEGTTAPDSFIVFTAHYDHLGKMGKHTTFYGASDNASGTAVMLYMAKYFAENPHKYSTAFIACGSEEAGLLGSKHFVANPLIPLSNIKWVQNIDIFGDATDGMSVVNGKGEVEAFSKMELINKEKGYLPKLVAGENSFNSDHAPFVEKGIPGVFVFSRGGPGFYHDINDQPKTLELNNIDKAIRLIIDFIKDIK